MFRPTNTHRHHWLKVVGTNNVVLRRTQINPCYNVKHDVVREIGGANPYRDNLIDGGDFCFGIESLVTKTLLTLQIVRRGGTFVPLIIMDLHFHSRLLGNMAFSQLPVTPIQII